MIINNISWRNKAGIHSRVLVVPTHKINIKMTSSLTTTTLRTGNCIFFLNFIFNYTFLYTNMYT